VKAHRSRDVQIHEIWLLLGFPGISDTTVIRAEGLAINAQVKDAAITQALEDIAAISA
jgi:FMN-dependent NADH-azoreductase